MVLLTPACWHHQRSGGGEARWPLFGDRDWPKSFDYWRLKSPGANNPEVKREATVILDELGLSMSTAVNAFLRALVREGGMPFEMKVKAPAPDGKAAR